DSVRYSNLHKFLASTIPTEATSTPYTITSNAKLGSDVLLTWTTFGGRTNAVQVGAGTTGSFTNNYGFLSPVIVVAGSAFTSTNYLDAGAGLLAPSRYYRVKQVSVVARDDASDASYSGVWTNGSNG